MTREEIIRMAREAGWKDLPTVRLAFAGFDLERFSELVATHEREACAQVVENYALGYAEPTWAFKLTATIRSRK